MAKALTIRTGLSLEYATLLWNVFGVIVVLIAATKAHSVALAGFGLDSCIEIGASIIVIWQLKNIDTGRKKIGLKLISISFYLLAIYILIQSIFALAYHVHPTESILGIVWLALTVIVMFALAYGKNIVGNTLNNLVLKTEAKVTLIDAYLASSVLISLILNARFGLWWTDSLAGLIIVFYGLKEGQHAWKESNI